MISLIHPQVQVLVKGYIVLFISSEHMILTLPMLRLLSSKAQGRGHVGIHWIALVEHSRMSTHVPGFQSIFRFLV